HSSVWDRRTSTEPTPGTGRTASRTDSRMSLKKKHIGSVSSSSIRTASPITSTDSTSPMWTRFRGLCMATLHGSWTVSSAATTAWAVARVRLLTTPRSSRRRGQRGAPRVHLGQHVLAERADVALGVGVGHGPEPHAEQHLHRRGHIAPVTQLLEDLLRRADDLGGDHLVERLV